MIDIYRYPADYVSREIPSGFVEQDEDPRAAALRELEEETGYKTRRLTNLGWFYPWTRSIQRAHLFLAEDLVKGQPKTDHTEQIRVKLVTIGEAKKMLRVGKITHSPTIIALQKLLLKKE
jgi:ADP-ribose pyrophosphatase